MNLELVFPGDTVLKRFDLIVLKLDNGSTGRTDQMIMVPFRIACFIPGEAVPETPDRGKTRLGKKMNRPVHSRETYGGIFLLDLQVKILRTDVSLVF